MQRSFWVIIILFLSLNIKAQHTKKSLNSIKSPQTIKVDGLLNEDIWQQAEIASDFIQFEPFNGKPSAYITNVKIVYTDYAVYIGATLFDPEPDSIMKQFSKRDEIGQTDYFGISFNPFNDGLMALNFAVTPVNVQIDSRISTFEDASWDAVWKSKTNITNEGWVAEIEIPFSELRFPKKKVQEWGINMVRNVQRSREQSYWNFIDAKVDGTVKQSGTLYGVKDVSPPIRLSLTPYVSGYILDKTGSNKTDYAIKGGLDLKYGINESYTLDMMLIPDFGQVESDDKVLNISAFETYYDEKRPFFTEGTELFDKGDIFYSRRIGSVKTERKNADFQLGENEVVESNPNETSIINATKITGRCKKGLGIGFLNGIAAISQARISDTLNGKSRTVTTQPITNYNVLVFDQSLKNNSYISLNNTNYAQPDFNYMSNVVATDIHIEDKKGNFAIDGIFGASYINDTNNLNSSGLKYEIELEKISGNFRFNIEQSLASKNYNQNDMGFLPKTDELETELGFAYNVYEPFWKILRWYNRVKLEHLALFSTKQYIGTELSFNTYTTFKNYLSVNLRGNATLGKYNDYFEPRVDGRVFVWPGYFSLGTFLSPDYRKKFLVDVSAGYWHAYEPGLWGMDLGIMPIIRFNDNLNLKAGINFNPDFNTYGYIDQSETADTIYFAQRDVRTVVNSLNLNYNFNAKKAITLRARHYWRLINFHRYYTLNTDGSLSATDDYSTDDISSNFFNIDLAYTWRFAPGSELSVVWKNSIENNAADAVFNYYRNLSDLLTFDKQNSISIRILYYIDYFKVKQRFI